MRQLLGRWEAMADHRNVVTVTAVEEWKGLPAMVVLDTGERVSLSLLEAWFRRVAGAPDAEVIAG